MNQISASMIEQEYINTKNTIEALKLKLQDIKSMLVDEYQENDSEHLLLTNVYKIPAKKSTSWKKVAETFNPSEELIDQNSTLSIETYGIRVRKPNDA